MVGTNPFRTAVSTVAYGVTVAYRQAQRSRLHVMMPGVGLVGLVAAIALGGPPGAVATLGAMVLLLAVLSAIFSRLTVTVEPDEVRATFGWGWPQRTIATSDIVAVRPVRNRWYHGWGIRLVSKGWMYNVSGFDAVELELTSGRVFRIGTDEPGKLAAAVESQVGARRRG